MSGRDSGCLGGVLSVWEGFWVSVRGSGCLGGVLGVWEGFWVSGMYGCLFPTDNAG